MLQESAVPGTLQVRELIDLFRSYYPAPLPLEHVLNIAGLSEQARTQAGRLSGGQKQRLYFALAICGDPKMLFLDEPTSGMDVEARRGLWAFVRSAAGRGRTILLTTHYLEEADALADRVVVINHGELIADGTPQSIKSNVPARRVRFDADPAAACRLLRSLPVHDVATSGHTVEFLTSLPEQVLQSLFRDGLAIRNLEVAGIQLEDAVLELTHG
jgi:ABC-2 type transport system ATP-binding protein